MLLEHLSRWAADHGDVIAAVSPDRRLTYRELAQSVGYTADRLATRGVGLHDVVGVTISGEIDHLITSLALLRTGCIQVALPSYEPRTFRQRLAERTRCTLVVCTDPRNTLAGLPAAVVEFGSESSANLAPPGDADSDRFYFASSGTTGETKIVPLSENQFVEQAKIWQVPRRREVYLRPTPIEFNNARRQRLYNVVTGGTNVFLETRTRDWAEFAQEHGVTLLALSAAQAHRLIDRAHHGGARLPEGCRVRVDGSAMPAPQRRAFLRDVTPQLSITYGATEFGSIATAGPERQLADQTSVGFAHPSVDVGIVDGEDRPLPAGHSGRIRLRGPGAATKYIGDAAAEAAAFRNGWFYPGDVGHIDADGVLTVEGRIDDMMILASINIFPFEIENVVAEHPAVRECAAFALSSETLGSIPMVAVVKRRDFPSSEILRFARERLGMRAPRRIVEVDSLPRNKNFKIDRIALRNQFAPKPPSTREPLPSEELHSEISHAEQRPYHRPERD